LVVAIQPSIRRDRNARMKTDKLHMKGKEAKVARWTEAGAKDPADGWFPQALQEKFLIFIILQSCIGKRAMWRL